MPCKAALTRTEAEMRVATAYERALGRNPFTANPYDAGAYDYVLALMYHGSTSVSIEASIRDGEEARARAVRVTRVVYIRVLRRDPGPPEKGAPWADSGAEPYAESFRLGNITEEELEAALMASEEYQKRRQDRASRPEVVDNVILDTATGRKDLEMGVSLFYALSPDVSREDFERVVDELAESGIRQARLAQTFTWDNPLGKENVIPFRPGKTYVHLEKGSVDFGRGVDPVFDEDHAEELSLRLNLLASRGIRAQYTIFWGGMQPLFTLGSDGNPGHPPGQGGRSVIWDRVGSYLEDVSRFFANHPEHLLEIINECDHGHHLGKLDFPDRVDFLRRCARIIRTYHPRALITASDGGHGPRIDGKVDAPEGSPYFDYHRVKELSYWNVHFPRDTNDPDEQKEVTVQGIPRWCRGSWHLYQDRGPFREAHDGVGGYGRSDENIFLRTPEEAEKWGYRGSTTDPLMYGAMLWVTTMAGAALTLHTHKGFFCEPGLTKDRVFDVVRAWRDITRDFPWHGATSFNSSWSGSPVKSFDGPFKAFALTSGENGRDVLVTVLNPNEGKLTLELDRPRRAMTYEITGELLSTRQAPAGVSILPLPKTKYQHALVVRLNG